jgi:cysteinyl-tRNA synthetase
MDDDFNSPAALAALQNFRGKVNKLLEDGLSSEGRREAREAFRAVGRVLGLFQHAEWQFNPADCLKIGLEEKANARSVITNADIDAKITERNEARGRKDFKKADDIRAELSSLGITIEDRPDGTSRWKR